MRFLCFVVLLVAVALTTALPPDEYSPLRTKRQWGGQWGGGHPAMTLPAGGNAHTGGGWAGRFPPGMGSGLPPGASPYGRKM
ncbi:hypothetical protein Y032_0087g2069 [Ancylostoma ceylanicum]|uniref:Uncharacterized protein n=1 Tax=Ancylostoma ceylanicum TaxID=53326 RepID=A0A016TQ59_9BILA|nr:hypothetical protein Y032_0087g2069 [Ancylostoma ceylanicum]